MRLELNQTVYIAIFKDYSTKIFEEAEDAFNQENILEVASVKKVGEHETGNHNIHDHFEIQYVTEKMQHKVVQKGKWKITSISGKYFGDFKENEFFNIDSRATFWASGNQYSFIDPTGAINTWILPMWTTLKNYLSPVIALQLLDIMSQFDSWEHYQLSRSYDELKRENEELEKQIEKLQEKNEHLIKKKKELKDGLNELLARFEQ